MKAVSLNFSRGSFGTPKEYRIYLINLLKPYKNEENCLVVLPGYSGLLLALNSGTLGTTANFRETYQAYLELPASWHEDLLSLHIQTARQLSLFMVCGTDTLTMNAKKYIVSYLVSPQGKILGCQKQLFLSREERSLGISRGEDAEVFSTSLGKIGLMLGSDAYYPEVGRILALNGAEMVCHCGALPGEQTEIPNYWRQMTGMWPQVQQNQFFCVESQLLTTIAGRNFQGSSCILAPCEMTGDKSGFLAWGGSSPGWLSREELSHEKLSPAVQTPEELESDGPGLIKPARMIPTSEPLEAHLNFEAREKVIKNYPLLKLLNPAAYGPLQFTLKRRQMRRLEHEAE